MARTACVSFADGCPRSQIDTGLLFKYFEANGWKLTSDPREADILLVGTCGFSQDAEKMCLGLMSGIMKRVKPSATVVAFGCLPGINETALTSRFNVIPLVRSKLSQLDEIIEAKVPLATVGDPNVIDEYSERAGSVFKRSDRLKVRLRPSMRKLARALAFSPTWYRISRDWDETEDGVHNIRIASGCLSECAYCAIKRAVGPLRSKPLDIVHQELESGLAGGHTKFRLIAEDVGAYGQDIGSSVVDLLDMVFSYTEDFKLSWDDFQPEWLVRYSDQLIPLMSRNAKRIGYIGFPMQSGSDQILRSMKRNYSANDATKCLRALQDAIPNLEIDTHIIIGFPGESKQDFQQTLQLLDIVRFRHPMPFIYSDRPGTESSKMQGKVPLYVQALRLYQFRKKVAAGLR